MNTLKNKYFIIFLFPTLVFFNSYSTTFPQEGFSYEELDLGNFMRNQINKHVRILNFELGKTTLNEIVRVLGKSALVIAGKGHDRVKQICYKSDKPSDHTLLIFSTNFNHGKIANEIKISNFSPIGTFACLSL